MKKANPFNGSDSSVYGSGQHAAFEVDEPSNLLNPYVLNSPHSGRIYLPEFIESVRLGHLGIRRSEDYLVDYLFEGGPKLGMPLLRANFPRAYLDVNREPYELDPGMFDGNLPAHVNTRSIRVSSGLGTIARIVAEGEEIYARRLSVEEGLGRIEHIYRPYHARLRQLLARTHVYFGCAILLDCHSMPSTSGGGSTEKRPDFVLGDRFGNACAPAITHHARAILRAKGFKVEVNKPYAGGFITEHYGRPENGLHALQVEVNRGLYMDETKVQPLPELDNFAAEMTDFLRSMAELEIAELGGYQPLAAE